MIEPSPRLLVAAAGFALFSTLCFALGPAWSLARQSVAGDLKGELGVTRRAARRFGISSMLVVGQLAVSLALVAGGGLFVRGGINAGRADTGFRNRSPRDRVAGSQPGRIRPGADQPHLPGRDDPRARDARRRARKPRRHRAIRRVPGRPYDSSQGERRRRRRRFQHRRRRVLLDARHAGAARTRVHPRGGGALGRPR